MAFKIKDRNGNLTSLFNSYRNFQIKQSIKELDYMTMEIPKISIDVFEVEGIVDTNNEKYLIKEINEQSDCYKVGAIQHDEKFDEFHVNKSYVTKTPKYMLEDLFGSGWTINCDVRTQRTVTGNHLSTFKIFEKIIKTFDLEYLINTINKTITLAPELSKDKGQYFTEELNLKKKYANIDSFDFATRIIPIGNDGLTIAAVNNGKNYLENYSYSNKVITYYWEDNRYTNVYNLKNDAKKKLDILSQPYKSYEINVIDLSQISGYESFSYEIGDFVYLLDKNGFKEKFRIVELTRHPHKQELNEIVLGNKIKDLKTDEKNLKEDLDNYWVNTEALFEVTKESVKSQVQTLEKDVNNSIDGVNNTIKEVKTTIEQSDRKVTERFEENEIKIDENTGQTSKNNKKLMEIEKSVDGLNITISSKADASDLNSKADKDRLITQINACPEYLKIASRNIYLDGNTEVRGSFNVSGNMVVGGTISSANINRGNAYMDSQGFSFNGPNIKMIDRDGRTQFDVYGTIAAKGWYTYELNSGGLHGANGSMIAQDGSGTYLYRPNAGSSPSISIRSDGVYIGRLFVGGKEIKG